MAWRISIVVALGVAAIAMPAALAHEVSVADITAGFRQYIESTPTVTTPAVVEVPLADIFLERPNVAVLDETTQTFEPSLLIQTIKKQSTLFTVTSDLSGSAPALVDNNPDTYVQYDVPATGAGTVRLSLQSASSIEASGFSLLLSPNVALPTHIEIRAGSPGNETIVVARQLMRESTVRFPTTAAAEWTVTLTYGQPLRLTQLRLLEEDVATNTTQFVRFLVQPAHHYRVYLDADRAITEPHHGEAADLASNRDVVKLAPTTPQPNPTYIIADSDKDGVPDVRDNCVNHTNADQVDANTNSRGDVCDDFDKDGIINETDNCPNEPNRNQADTDDDALGDACDDSESRITEANPWLPWLGIGLAAVVVIFLLVITTRSVVKSKAEPSTTPPATPPASDDQNPPEKP